MAPQTDLSKVGFEGFGMVENLRKGSAPQYHQQQVQHPHHYHYRQQQTPPQTNFVEVIDCYEAVRKYGGVLEVEKHRYNKQAPPPRISSYDAAQMYNGVLFVDNNNPRKKQNMLRKPYY